MNSQSNTRRALIIGGSSGIGAELARQLSAQGWEVGLTGRRTELLKQVADSLPTRSWIETMDVTRPEDAGPAMERILAAMEDVELIIVNSGIGGLNKKLAWEIEEQVVLTNVLGFTLAVNVAYHYLVKRGRGHLVGMSSVAGVRGLGAAAAYSGSKAFVSNYLEGLRQNLGKRGLPVVVTDLRPGFVKTPLTEGQKGMFWVSEVEVAAAQMIRAIEKQRSKAWITRRWGLAAALVRILPGFLYKRI